MQLYLLAHQDDEFFVLSHMRTALRKGEDLAVIYLTDGGARSTERDGESRRVLTRLGVRAERIVFLGSRAGLPDGELFRHLGRAFGALSVALDDLPAPDEIITHAWEGGHHDHDCVHALAALTAIARGWRAPIRQAPFYREPRRVGNFFAPMSPLAENGAPIRRRRRWADVAASLATIPAYRTQWRTFRWHGPAMLARRLVSANDHLQSVRIERLAERPHAGQLYYERVFNVAYEDVSRAVARLTRVLGLRIGAPRAANAPTAAPIRAEADAAHERETGLARRSHVLKIAILTPFFFPEFGGTQRAVEILAREFVALGHEVRILTLARDPKKDERPQARGDIPDTVAITRRADPLTVLSAMRSSDVGLIFYPTLRLGLPALFSRKPCVLAHHFKLGAQAGVLGAPQRLLRQFLMRRFLSVACSECLADTIPAPTRVIYSGYRDDIWRPPAVSAPRPTDVLFVGRLVPDKGVDVFLEALAVLKARGRALRAVMIGAEDEGLSVARMAQAANVSDIVSHFGPMAAADVARAQAHAKIAVIPSRHEAFGIVALEAMAMGAVVVASNTGGLPEAVGSAGRLVDPHDPRAWADTIEALLDNPRDMNALRAAAATHLEQFSARRMAAGYLDALHEALAQEKQGPEEAERRFGRAL
ncbi:MAG: glycosyltransferase [Hyphomonadaceae bacterium]